MSIAIFNLGGSKSREMSSVDGILLFGQLTSYLWTERMHNIVKKSMLEPNMKVLVHRLLPVLVVIDEITGISEIRIKQKIP